MPGRLDRERGSVKAPDPAMASEVLRGRWAEFRVAAAEGGGLLGLRGHGERWIRSSSFVFAELPNDHRHLWPSDSDTLRHSFHCASAAAAQILHCWGTHKWLSGNFYFAQTPRIHTPITLFAFHAVVPCGFCGLRRC